MECNALSDPRALAHLISELDGAHFKLVDATALTSEVPAQFDPGRKLLWIIPTDARAGANPSLWIREHRELLDRLIDRSTAHTNLVFAGTWPERVDRQFVEIMVATPAGSEGGRRRMVRREIRIMSAAAHIWVDRLKVHDQQGQIEHAGRHQRLRSWAGKFWGKEQEESYITANLQPVHKENSAAVQARDALLENRPSTPDRGFVVIYGQGGVGKTFFLSRLANKLSKAAEENLTAPIPVLVQLRGVLHEDALENWLSRSGFQMLSLPQITALVRHGVVVPLLDALDEVVKGDAHRGGDEFLDHIFNLGGQGLPASGVLACRDYYLTADRALVSDRASRFEFPQLFIGPFAQQDTRKYIQVRTGLTPEHAGRWASALEKEASQVVGEEADLEVIRHPIVLDTLARYILEIPKDRRANAASEFRLTRAEIFGDIVDELLRRERHKHTPQWQARFSGQLGPDWMDPFDFQKQRKVLKQLTLLVARAGGLRSQEPADNKDLRHGLSAEALGIGTQATRIEALQKVLREVYAKPQVTASVPEEDVPRIEDEALRHLAEAYGGHILAEPALPDNVVFALRHRFYFDYFLADALLEQLEAGLASRISGESLTQWCVMHHVADVFATCLDFLLWDSRVAQEGLERLGNLISGEGPADFVLASYLASLALAVFLRQRQTTNRTIARLLWRPTSDLELLLVNDFLPKELSSFKLEYCSFPSVAIDALDLKDVQLDACDFRTLQFHGACRLNQCNLEELECDNLQLNGDLTVAGSTLDIQGKLIVGPGAHVKISHCVLSDSLRQQLEDAKLTGAYIVLVAVTTRESPEVPTPALPLNPGRRFVNRLMALLRREGRTEFAVYSFKLRDKTPGNDTQFARAVELLGVRGITERRGDMIVMTPQGTSHMYHRRLFGRPGYDCHDAFWEPIVRDLDRVLGAAVRGVSG